MQTIWLPPGCTSQIIQDREYIYQVPCLADLDHKMGSDDQAEAWKYPRGGGNGDSQNACSTTAPPNC